MIASTLYTRVVPQDRGRGWILLVSWEKPVVQATCAQLLTMGAVTQKSMDELLLRVKLDHRASKMEDVTSGGIMRRLLKQFKDEASAEVQE